MTHGNMSLKKKKNQTTLVIK